MKEQEIKPAPVNLELVKFPLVVVVDIALSTLQHEAYVSSVHASFTAREGGEEEKDPSRYISIIVIIHLGLFPVHRP